MSKTYQSSEQSGVPLSGGREANGLVFVSGQVHLDENGSLAGESIEERFRLVLENVRKILAEAGLDLKDIVSVRLFLTDLSQLPRLNVEYSKHFAHPMPSRTTIGVAALPLGASLEMDAIAALS